MNKKQAKALRIIAANLNDATEQYILKEHISGAELLLQGVTQMKDGSPVEKHLNYVREVKKTRKVNHLKKLKQVARNNSNAATEYIKKHQLNAVIISPR